VVISSPQKVAMITRVEEEWQLDQICTRVTGVDLIITEGYKRANRPKIEVFRQGVALKFNFGLFQ
jgi:molybdopterin-guanine dinucleotide biosynthesis protein B